MMINFKFEDAKGAIRSRASRKNKQYIQCPIKGGKNVISTYTLFTN
jgi:hypothetical protein